MRKHGTILLALLAAACSGPRLSRQAQGAQVLEVRGAVKGGPFPIGAGDLAALPRRTVHGQDPSTGRDAAWEGVALATLAFDRVDLVKGADVVVIRTADRRAIPIPLGVVRQLRPVLADHAGGERLPELVLAWPTADQPGLLTDPRARSWWAHGVVALELVNGLTSYGRALAVSPGAPDGARLGADLFGASCTACHRLRGVGGERGPDLTHLAARLPEPAFAALMPGHPGWRDRGAEPGEATARQVWAFLKAVDSVAAEAAPEEPMPEERPRRRGGY